MWSSQETSPVVSNTKSLQVKLEVDAFIRLGCSKRNMVYHEYIPSQIFFQIVRNLCGGLKEEDNKFIKFKLLLIMSADFHMTFVCSSECTEEDDKMFPSKILHSIASSFVSVWIKLYFRDCIPALFSKHHLKAFSFWPPTPIGAAALKLPPPHPRRAKRTGGTKKSKGGHTLNGKNLFMAFTAMNNNKTTFRSQKSQNTKCLDWLQYQNLT